MQLVKIAKSFLEFNNALAKLFPKKKKVISGIFISLIGISDYLLYEHKKEDYEKHPLYKKPFKIWSALSIGENILKINKLSKPDLEKLEKHLSELETILSGIRFNVNSAKKNTNNLLDHIDNILVKKYGRDPN